MGVPFSPLTEAAPPPAAATALGPSAAGSRMLPEPDGMTPAVAAKAAARASLAGGAAAASPSSAAGGGWLACRFSSSALGADDKRAPSGKYLLHAWMASAARYPSSWSQSPPFPGCRSPAGPHSPPAAQPDCTQR